MKRLLSISMLFMAASCAAQSLCHPYSLVLSATAVTLLQHQLALIKTGEMDLDVPPLLSEKLVELKEALGAVSNTAMPCVEPSATASDLQRKLAQVLHANAPYASAGTPEIDNEQKLGSYGGNLQVQVSRPGSVAGVLEVQYTFDIECGVDTLLQIYELHDGVWTERLRWQAPPLRQISDAFGDFFVTSFVLPPPSPNDNAARWLMAVAHGTPRCTSRFSGFKVDLLAPGSTAFSPRVVWHTEREYSRSAFDPTLKSLGNTFELRVNADCMSFDSARCFERRVIYRYTVDKGEQVRRVTPIALNARGFVSEWIRAPWSEVKAISIMDPARSLERVHDQFNAPSKPDLTEYVLNTYGAVLRCKAPKTFQVEIGSTLEKTVPGKPGGESSPLPSRYFHVRATGDGYMMLSASQKPDSSCSGGDLMSEGMK